MLTIIRHAQTETGFVVAANTGAGTHCVQAYNKVSHDGRTSLVTETVWSTEEKALAAYYELLHKGFGQMYNEENQDATSK